MKKALSQFVTSNLAANMTAMALLQAVNLLLPLFVVPLIINKFGIEKFGLISYATAICAFINVVCDYGFNLTATRDIANNVSSKAKLSEIFSTVITLKILILLTSLIVFSFVILNVDRFKVDAEIYFLTFGMVVGNVLMPLWFYQGIKKFKFILGVNVLFKVIFLLVILFFVEGNGDLYKVPLFISLGYIIPGLVAFLWALIKYDITLSYPGFDAIRNALADGWYIFATRAALYSYTSMNIIFLELFTNNTVVGYFSIARNVTGATSSIIGAIMQAIYPYTVDLWSRDKHKYFQKLSQLFMLLVGVMPLIAIVLYIFSPFIVSVLSGEENNETIITLRILCFSLLLAPFGTLFSQSFIVQKKNNIVFRVTFKTMIVNFILVLLLVPLFSLYGLAIAVCAVQIFHLLLNLKNFSSTIKEQQAKIFI